MITLGLKIGEPASPADQRVLDWTTERLRAGLPIADVIVIDRDGNELILTK